MPRRHPGHVTSAPVGAEPAAAEDEVQPVRARPADPLPPRPDQALRDADIDWDANEVMRRLGHIGATMTRAAYSHGLRVDEQRGIYEFDCSGFVYWLLKKEHPRSASALAWKLDHRPLARDIHRRIASVPMGQSRHGWRRIARVDELEPGDVLAWVKPSIIRSPNTGHTAFVLLPPLAVPDSSNAYLVRVADSTSLLHDDDTRVGRDGFGFGTILLVADPETGAPIEYGWSGRRWRTFATKIALGRALE